ncbi:type II toxin-antitoxin system VapB family antitoxin [Sphingomonas sp. SUN019]|uniref:type II toxin-antitoxin system VapB family antitoxin n=1 Tax=Sphingomonas sp. SUN019 TaxID=2937788 RepID=UPI002164E7CF|nr:type II toxin-antitoxin system VapB family antitoxin [Sphingomonas sp. SUN019]UVO51782.1 type II toxin-antitoxin system VapB family antitoxin [Sphingomonas sp. SUN019]
MGVQLNIKDPETVRLARELAGDTGRTVTETVRAALQRAHEDRADKIQAKIAKMNAAVDRLRKHLPPEWKGRTSKEIMDELYDEDGLPI